MNKALLMLAMLAFFASCANYKLNIAKEIDDPIPDLPAGQKITHTLYLLGDGGNSKAGKVAPAVRFLGEQLKTADENSTVIFMGDNIYPGGFPGKKDPGRALAEHRLEVQLDILKGFKGKAWMIPGNHDWRSGLKRLKKEEDFLEEYAETQGDLPFEWIPDDGCSGPEVVEVNDNLVIIFIDSEWWLMDWNKEPELNEGCEIKSKENFLYFFEEAMKKYRNKNIVIAMHHPLYSNGPHGGRFTFSQHIFPLTQVNPKLYIPLPGIGTIFSFLRMTVGSRQDIAHPELHELRKGLEASAKKNGQFIFVSGHEHNLQLFEKDSQVYLISGSGSKISPAGRGNDAVLTYGHVGHSVIKFFDDGSAWAEFWVPEGDGTTGRLIFRKKIKGPLPALTADPPQSFPEYESNQSAFARRLDPSPRKGRLHRIIWGEHYREAYRAEVTAPKFDLETFRGGMTPIKRGGGYQTNSLRLLDADGHQWVMRDMLKDATRIVPYPFNQTIAKDVFADQFTSAHPYAAFVIAPMAASVHIYHTNPKLFYV
ncbi:MAG: metallophosphoesterase, partial [Bacteroidetes bacterium]